MYSPAENDRNYALYQNAIFWVEVERIVPNPFQPRRTFDEVQLKELAESIRMYGLLQPLTVTKREKELENGGIQVEYELIAGERRLRASKIAGLSQVPVIIRTGEESDQMKLELAIIENLQREDLNAVDRAEAFQKLYKDFGFTHKQIGLKMGKSREYVANTLRLLQLPEHIRTYVREGRVNEGHTRPLLMLNDKPQEQAVLVKEILIKKISVREAEKLARHSAQEKVRRDHHKLTPEIVSLERSLTETLGTRVTIEPRETGGRVVISFFSPEDLQALLQVISAERNTARNHNDAFVATVGGVGAAVATAPEAEVTHSPFDALQSDAATDTIEPFSGREAVAYDEVDDAEESETEKPVFETNTDEMIMPTEITLDVSENAPEYEEPATITEPEQQGVVPEAGRPLPEEQVTEEGAREYDPADVALIIEEHASEERQETSASEQADITQPPQQEKDATEESELYSLRDFTI
jgi:ParB family transcriptional regulator, chromosome partitioning protein